MTTWDEKIFAAPTVAEFLEELQGEYGDAGATDGLYNATVLLKDTVMFAQKQALRGEAEYTQGLAAATIAAIWCGAPYSVAVLVEQYPVIKGGYDQCDGHLQENSGILLDAELTAAEGAGDEVPEGLETYLEALS